MTIPLFKVFMSEDVIEPVNTVLRSGYVTQGKQVEKYEAALKEFIGNPFLLTLNSATAGLTLALRLLKNKDDAFNWPGFDDTIDVVLTPALTCFATTAAVLSNNVNIRWLDVDLDSANISLEDLKKKLNEHTKIIYLVHWGGTPVDLDELDEICENHKAKYGFKPMVVEDCAHAFGAEFGDRKLSNHGNICVYSTQAIKHLTTGDGGIITLPNKKLYCRCKLLRWYGIDREKRNYKGKDFRLENDIMEWGYKFHMNDINATLGLYNLPHMARLLKKNRENGRYFDKHLKDVSGVQLMKNNPKCNSVYWLYTIRVLNGKKQEFMTKMKEAGIMTSQVHNRNDINSCVKEFEEILPNLDILEKELVCIPVGWWLEEKDLEKIVKTISTIFNVMTEWESIWNARSYNNEEIFAYNGYTFKNIGEYEKFITEMGKNINIVDNDNILDIGCGNGTFTDIMIQLKNINNTKLHGIDFCQKSVDYACKHIEGNFIWGNITHGLPYKDNTFDVIICMSTLFYLKDEETVYNLLQEIDRVRKPNSFIYLGNCMDFDKKSIAVDLRKSTHPHKSHHLYLKKSLFKNYYKREYVKIIDNVELDISFYTGQSYKFNMCIETKKEQVLGVDFHDTISAYPTFFRRLMGDWKGRRIIITGTPKSKEQQIIRDLYKLGIYKTIHYDKIEYGYEYNKEDMDYSHFNRMKKHKQKAITNNKIDIYYDDNPFYVNYLKDFCKNVFQPILSSEYIEAFNNDKYFCCNLQEHQFDNLKKLENKIKVYVPGTFDMFHCGHLKLIKKIKKMFNCKLVIGVQDDESVKSTKGKYPVMNINERIEFIKNLDDGYEVIQYNNMDQSEVLKRCEIDVFIIGPEFGQYPEHQKTLEYCKNNKIQVEIIERTEGISSTDIKNRISVY